MVRTNNSLTNLRVEYEKILKLIFIKKSEDINIEYVKTIYKLIAYTRDIINGKGEYKLSHMLVSDLYNFANKYLDINKKDKVIKMAEKMLECFVKWIIFIRMVHIKI